MVSKEVSKSFFAKISRENTKMDVKNVMLILEMLVLNDSVKY